MIPHKWIDATDLNQWANRRDSQARLPQLLRRLVHATVQQPRRVGFPSGDSVQMGGWDGIIDAPEGNDFVPDGDSVWELGVNRDTKGKADDDYQKRSTNPLGVDPTETTFVFVTPRRWGGKDKWVREKNDEGTWAEVRAYDADDLEQWLELAPAVHAWLAQVVGKWSEDAQDIGSFWDEWIISTSPPMNAQLHLTGREKEVEKIHEWLNRSPSHLTIQADSQEEAIAFFAAVIHALPEERRVEYHLSRCIIAQSESSWRYFGRTQDPLILIPGFEQPKSPPREHHILVPVSREISPSQDALQLPRLDRTGFRQALVNMGLPEERAYSLTKESKRNLLVLRRLLAIAPEIHYPDWAKSGNARSLIPALLAGAWDDTKEADREAIVALAGKPYQDVIANLARWQNSSDPPIRRIGNIWQLVSREDSWHLLSRLLIPDDLEAFKSVALSVLGTPDPKYELPPDERFAARVYGKELPHSDLLRQGLTETLAILATRGLPSEIQHSRSAQSRANEIVRQLLNSDTDWQRWASLSYLLPTLAEAAPEVFVETVDQALVGESPVLLGMFAEEGAIGSSPHTGLLWALEIFAWEPQYLSRVALILAKLTRLDPGGKLLNRPFNSLYEIFLYWNPQTPATLEQRLQVIDMLLAREPEVAWKLLCSLLPRISGSVSHPINKPHWRDWTAKFTSTVTVSEYWQNINAVMQRVLSNVGTSSNRLYDVIESIESLPPELRDQALDFLDTFNSTNLKSADRAKIWNRLRYIIHMHREYSDAKWAMPTEVVNRLYLIYQKFEPKEFIYRYAWIFSPRPPLLHSRHKGFHENQRVVQQKQGETAKEIYAHGGLTAFLEMSEQVTSPGYLGAAIAQIETIADIEIELLRATLGQENKAHNALGIGFVHSRLATSGWDWVEEMLSFGKAEQWSAQQIVNFFYSLPFAERTWNLLNSFGEEVETLYWQNIPVDSVHPDDCVTAIRRLLQVNRPYASLNLATLCLSDTNETTSLTPQLLVEILEKAALVDPYTENPPPDTNCLGYYIEQILGVIEASDTIEANTIPRLEWIYLPVLTHGLRQPKLLHQELSRDPLFFAEIIKCVYKSENEQDDTTEPDESVLIRAERGNKLLDSWHQLPGLTEEGRVDAEKLKNWVIQARTACQESGRGKIGDRKIGKILAYSPQAPDGTWPHIVVREIIEELSSREIEEGIERGVYNKRGVYYKSIGEGGLQERELAETYQNYAIEVAYTHPRTAALLRRIATYYDSYAHSEDIGSELENY
jgi:hypothetical protein